MTPHSTHRGHELEVEAGTAHQTVHGGILRHSFDLGQVLVDELGNLLQRFGRRLVSGVLASPFAADAVEGHGAIGEGHGVGRHVAGECGGLANWGERRGAGGEGGEEGDDGGLHG